MYHLEYDYAMARAIHEERLREAEADRAAAAIRAARRAIRSATSRVETIARIKPAARRAA